MKLLDFPLLTDENVQAAIVVWLRERGVDTQTIFEEGLGRTVAVLNQLATKLAREAAGIES